MKSFKDSFKPAANPAERHLVQAEDSEERHEFLFNPVRIEVGGEIFEMTAIARKKRDNNSISRMLKTIDKTKEWSFATKSQLAAFRDQCPERLSTSQLLALGEMTPRASSPIDSVSLRDGQPFTQGLSGLAFNSDWDFLIVRKM